MIKKHFVRAFERGAWHDHRPNIGLKRGSSQVSFEPEDSSVSFYLYVGLTKTLYGVETTP